MGVFLTQANFSRGEVDEQAQDRADAELLQTGALQMVNFLPQLAGGVRKRPNLLLPPSDEAYATIEPSSSFTDEYIEKVKQGVPVASYFFQYGSLDVLIFVSYSLRGSDEKDAIQVRAYLYEDFVYLDSVGEDSFFNIEDEADSRITVPDDLPFDLRRDEPDPLNWYVRFSRSGPTTFITSPYFEMRRVYITYEGGSSKIEMEKPQFYEELYGEAFAYNENTIVFIDGAAVEVLSTGDTINFQDEEGEIDDIYDYDSSSLDGWVYDDYPSARGVKLTSNVFSGKVYGQNAPTGNAYVPLDNPFGGNPHLSTFHQGRFMVFSTWENPTRMWASRPQNPFVIRGNAEEPTSPIEYDLAADKAEVFSWVTVQDRVLLGTRSAEYVVDSLSDQPLSPGEFGFYKVSEQGASSVQPAQSDSALFVVPRGRSAVAIYQYSDSVQGFKAQILTSVSAHLFRNGIQKVVYEPPRGDTGTAKIYALVKDDDGYTRLVVCMYNESSETVGWCQLNFDMDLYPTDVNELGGRVYIIMAGGAPRDDKDETEYVKLVLCVLDDSPSGISADLFHGSTVDSDKRVYLAEAYSTIVGDRAFVFDKDYLWQGEYEIKYDEDEEEAYLDVDDSELEEDDEVYVGVAFSSRLEMFPPAPSPESVNRKARVIRIMASVYDSVDLRINDVSALQGPPKTGRPSNYPVSGTYEVRTLGWEERPTAELRSSWPYNCTVLSVTREVQVQ